MQSRSTNFIVTVASAVLFCTQSIASPRIVKGRISDSEGAAIKDAHLLFHPDRAGQNEKVPRQDKVRETDEAGHFDVHLEPGFWDVCVMATAFTAKCRKILVSEGGVVQHDVQLTVDPLVTQHLGDIFLK